MCKRKDSVATPHLGSSKQGLIIVLCGLCAIATLDYMLICLCNRDAMRRKTFAVDLVEAPTSPDRESYLRHPSKLLILVPFTARDMVSLSENLDRWRKNGPACDARVRENNVSDMWFYYSKTSNELPTQFSQFQATKAYRQLDHCFSRVVVAFANLTTEEDDYPVGINIMFYRLVAGETHAHDLRDFNALYWMEPDVEPIKPYWLNALVRESLGGDDFWMKGSIYLGDLFDGAGGQDWTWAGHINGNALYRLHQPMFTQFLQIVMDLEPPGHFWKPFDVSIWKVLHDFPYFWHAHQRIAKHFMYADFVEHWGFTITDDEIVNSVQHSRTYMVHGRKNSSAKHAFTRKFKNERSSVNWDGAIEPMADNISVFLRSNAIDIEYVIVAISSVIVHMRGALEIVVVVPEKDVPAHRGRLGPLSTQIKVLAEKPLTMNRAHIMQEIYTRSLADVYCRGKHIFHMRPDSVLMRRVLRKDFFFAGKPIMHYSLQVDMPEQARLWRNGTANALGEDIRLVFVRESKGVIPRDVYKLMRSHIERIHHTPFRSFLRTRVGQRYCLLHERDSYCPSTQKEALLDLAYSQEIALGSFMFARTHAASAWLPLEGSREYARQTFVPIITHFTCQGHAWLARKVGQMSRDIQALESAKVSGSCEKVKDWRLAWKDSLRHYVG